MEAATSFGRNVAARLSDPYCLCLLGVEVVLAVLLTCTGACISIEGKSSVRCHAPTALGLLLAFLGTAAVLSQPQLRDLHGVTLLLHGLFFVSFLVALSTFTPPRTDLVAVHTILRINPGCASGRLLEVEERLTYKVQGEGSTAAVRVLPNQAEPIGFQVAAPDQYVPGLTIRDVARKEMPKWRWDYETGQVTTVTVAFDKLSADSPQVASRELRFLLSYLARPTGDGLAVSHEVGSSEWARVAGGWTVSAPPAAAATLEVDCGADVCGPGSWELEARPSVSRQARTWDVMLRVPVALGVGGPNCPFAWQVPVRNLFWRLGGACVIAALLVLLCCASFADNAGGSAGAAPVLCLGCAGVFLLLAVLLCIVGALVDHHSGEDSFPAPLPERSLIQWGHSL